MIKRAFLPIFLLLLLCSFLPALASPPTRTVVVEFANKTDWWGERYGTHTADMLINRLRRTGHYSFLPRREIRRALGARSLPQNIYLKKDIAVEIGEELGARLVITGRIESIKVIKYYRYVPAPPPPPPYKRRFPPPRRRVVEKNIATLRVKIKVRIVDTLRNKTIWEGTKSGDVTFPKGVLYRPGPKGKWMADVAERIVNEALDKIAYEIEKRTEYLRK